MRARRTMLILLCILFICSSLSGCKLVREVDNINLEGLSGETPITADGLVTLRVDDGKALDEEAILDFFYGEDRDTLFENGYIKEFYYNETLLEYECIKDGIQINYYPGHELDSGDGPNFFYMYDVSGGLDGEEYKNKLSWKGMHAHYLYSFYERYLKIEIDIQTIFGKEIVDFCMPLIEACGYENAQVKIYKLENDYPEIVPDAYIVICQSLMNGLVLDSSKYELLCIYVPEYKRIVYAEAQQSLVAVEVLEKVEAVTKEQAVGEAVRAMRLESADDITVLKMDLVYSPIDSKVNKDADIRMIEPCWRIDYKLSDDLADREIIKYKDNGTIFINAVNGKESE